MEPEKLEATMSLEEMELMHLTSTASSLCIYDPAKTRANHDEGFAEIIEKARAYMNLALDAGIAKLSKVNLH